MPVLFYITVSGPQNGVNPTFSLSQIPGPLLEIYRNGILQTPTVDYTVSTTTLTFTPGNIPGAPDILLGITNSVPAPPSPPLAPSPTPSPGGAGGVAAGPAAVQAFPPHRGTPQYCAVPEITAKMRESLRQIHLQEKARNWPYRWIFPEGTVTRHVRFSKTIPAPAPGVITVVAGYQVAIGYGFLLTHILQTFTGSGFIPGSGSITWSIDVNTDQTTPFVQGMAVQGFTSEVVPLGETDGFPWPLENPEWLSPQDFLRSKVVTTAAITAGAPNFFTSMFLGWEFPIVTLV